jgi:GAF domain-containing protein
VPTSLLERNLDEARRLAVLHEYQLLGSPADYELSAVVRVAAAVAEVPAATLNLIDETRQCQLATAGFDGADSPRSESMCAVEFRGGRFVHVPDCTRNPLYANNPWVNGRLGDVRFYASAPLITPSGYILGTLCVVDTVAKKLRPEQVSRLLDLADIIVGLFERRRLAREKAELAAEQEHNKKLIETVLDTVDVGIAVADPAGAITLLNRAAQDWQDVVPESLPLLRKLPDGPITAADVTISRPGGPDVELSCNARQIIADDGELLGAVVAMRDVTADRS